VKRHPWITAAVAVAASLLLIVQAPSLSAQPPQDKKAQPPKSEQITDLEKQIASMQKKLEAMKAAQTTTAKKVSPTQLSLPEEWTKAFRWRSIGPASMAGRITAISVFPGDPSIFWAATASGGLIKTENNGISFEHQFDKENTVSIGDVCVAPSDKNIVWVGTGENNPRNSVSYGDGIYKSTDGGKTFKHMGLKETYQIGKVLVHPKNPDIVYVGAMGRCYGPNPERGLYKTTDGGKNWQKIFYLDDKTGVIDMQLDPSNPETLVVAMWTRQRDEFDSFLNNTNAEGYDSYDPSLKWGPNAGLYKTTDGGKTFKKLTKGLPSSQFGRIGIDFYQKNPKVLFAIIDCQKIGMGTPPAAGTGNADFGAFGQGSEDGVKLAMVRPERSAANAGLLADDLVTEVDGKKVTDMEDIQNIVADKKVNDKIKVKYKRGPAVKEVEVTLLERQGGPGGRGGQGGGQAEGGRTAQAPGVYIGIVGENAEDAGARVKEVLKGSPAEKAGIKVGDVITGIDGRDIVGYNQILFRIRDKKAGDKLKLNTKRGSKTEEIEVTLAARPAGVTSEVPPAVAAGGGAGGGGQGFGGPGGATRARPYAAYYGGQRENVQERQGPNGHEYGGIYKSTDGGESWTRVNSLNPRPMYFSLIRVDPNDDKIIFVGGVSMHWSQDGGKSFRTNVGRQVHADHHALWISPANSKHMMVGCDGGLYVSYDRMQRVDHLNTMAMGQFYHVATDNRHPYFVYGGLQDNGSWGGPNSVPRPGGSTNEDWLNIGGGDGFVCQVDQDDNDWIYSESQNGAMSRRNIKTGERGFIRPRAQQGVTAFRFNWNTPFILSRKNQKVFYCSGQYVFRSFNRGDDLHIISPEITRTKRGSGTALSESPRNADILWAGTDDGHLWVTKDGGKEWTNVTKNVGLPSFRWVATIEASRFADGRAYVAFDCHRSNDDKPCVYVTEDFGATWKPIMANLPEFGSTRCLREDITNPDLLFCGTEFAVFASIDRGLSWTKINNNLPTVAVHEIAVHPHAGEIVAATHGRSLWVLDIGALREMKPDTVKSIAHLYQPHEVIRTRSEPSRGGTTRRYVGENAPNGAQIYFSLNKPAEKVSLKVVDAKGDTLQEIARVPKDAGLHKVSWNLARTGGGFGMGNPFEGFGGGGGGARRGGGQAAARTEGQGGQEGQAAGARRGGQGAQEGQAAGGGGRRGAGGQATGGGQGRRAGGQAGGGGGGGGAQGPIGFPGGGGGGRGFGGATVPAGTYCVILTVDGKEYKQTVRVVADPNLPNGVIFTEEEEEAWENNQKTYRRQLEKHPN